MTIPGTYRQLTRDQILQALAGQQEATAQIELVRLHEPDPQLIYAGKSTLYLQWSNYDGRRKLKPHEPRSLAIIKPTAVVWAEYSPQDIGANGDMMAEDYLMRMYSPHGTGPLAAESNFITINRPSTSKQPAAETPLGVSSSTCIGNG